MAKETCNTTMSPGASGPNVIRKLGAVEAAEETEAVGAGVDAGGRRAVGEAAAAVASDVDDGGMMEVRRTIFGCTAGRSTKPFLSSSSTRSNHMLVAGAGRTPILAVSM